MSKKPMRTVSPELTEETQADQTWREARNAYIDKWKGENSDYVRDLKKESKEFLIDVLIRVAAGCAYDINPGESQTEEDLIAEVVELEVLRKKLWEGGLTQDEQRSALAQWEAEMTKKAGINIARISQIQRMVGSLKLQIAQHKNLEAAKQLKKNLALGPLKAGAIIRDKSNARYQTVRSKVFEISASRLTADMTPGQIANRILKEQDDMVAAKTMKEDERIGIDRRQITNLAKRAKAEYKSQFKK